MGTKESIDNIWERYAKTLKLLSNALNELDKKPKEVIIEKIVEVEKDTLQLLLDAFNVKN